MKHPPAAKWARLKAPETLSCALFMPSRVGCCVYFKSAGPLSNRGNCVNSNRHERDAVFTVLFVDIDQLRNQNFYPDLPFRRIQNNAPFQSRRMMVHFSNLSLKISAAPVFSAITNSIANFWKRKTLGKNVTPAPLRAAGTNSIPFVKLKNRSVLSVAA